MIIISNWNEFSDGMTQCDWSDVVLREEKRREEGNEEDAMETTLNYNQSIHSVINIFALGSRLLSICFFFA